MITLTLPEVLLEYSRVGSEFAFVMQGGNQGDNMIYLGANKLAKEIGIKYSTHYCPAPTRELVVPIPKFDKDVIIYMHGGGGFNHWWAWSPKLLKGLRDNNPNNIIIVGPSSFELDESLIKELPSDVTYFAREWSSYRLLSSIFPSVYIDHDTALHLKMGDGYIETLIDAGPPREIYNLLAIRGDKESASPPKGINLNDYAVQVDPCTSKNWARVHMDAATILTNRCHSAVLGSILGKKTTLFPGSYHKNKSIWEFSLKQRGVNWIE